MVDVLSYKSKESSMRRIFIEGSENIGVAGMLPAERASVGKNTCSSRFHSLALIHDGKAGIHRIRRIARVPERNQPMAVNAVSAPRRL